MKIEGVSSSVAAQNRKAEKTAASGFVVMQETSETKSEAASTPLPTANLSSLGSLLAVQEEDSPQERKRRAIYRADSLLDMLDELKIATIEGRVTLGLVSKLSDGLKERLEIVDDPKLQLILEEVELRAQVELAKLQTNL